MSTALPHRPAMLEIDLRDPEPRIAPSRGHEDPGVDTPILLLLAAPGARGVEFADRLTSCGQIGRPRRIDVPGEWPCAERSHPSMLGLWHELAPGEAGRLLDRLGHARVVILRRRDPLTGAVVEHREELALARRLPTPCKIGGSDLDPERIEFLHRTANERVDEWRDEVRRRGLPALHLRTEDWEPEPQAVLAQVHHWLDLTWRPSPETGPASCSRCEASARTVARALAVGAAPGDAATHGPG